MTAVPGGRAHAPSRSIFRPLVCRRSGPNARIDFPRRRTYAATGSAARARLQANRTYPARVASPAPNSPTRDTVASNATSSVVTPSSAARAASGPWAAVRRCSAQEGCACRMLARMSSRLRSAPPSSPAVLRYITRMPRMGPDGIEELSEEPRANVYRIVRLELVVQSHGHVERLALHEARRRDTPGRPALGQAAGEGDRLLDRQARVDHVRARSADISIQIKALSCRNVDDVAVAQDHVAFAELQVPS